VQTLMARGILRKIKVNPQITIEGIKQKTEGYMTAEDQEETGLLFVGSRALSQGAVNPAKAGKERQ